MNTGRSITHHENDPGCRRSEQKVLALIVGLIIAVSLLVSFLVQPYANSWLEVRTAYRNLSSPDDGTRMDAINLLRRSDKKTESTLIGLLHHPDVGVRSFVASELAMKTPVTDDIIEAFFAALDSNHHVSEIGWSAPSLFRRHAEIATGPLSETDERMIAWLKAEMSSSNLDRRGNAAWGVTGFVNRDPSVREPLDAYLKSGTFFYRYIVMRELVERDPSMCDEYVELLIHGLGSSNPADQHNALYGLTHLKSQPNDLGSRLDARRNASADPGEILRINQAMRTLRIEERDSENEL